MESKSNKETEPEFKVVKMIETFEIQRKARNLKDEKWAHYNWYATWEIGEINIIWLRNHKARWLYQLLRERTTIELTRLA